MELKNPLFGSDTRAQIIEIVKKEKQISAKRIFYALKKKYISSKTYQSVHKILQKMVEDGILIKKELDYEISLKWVAEVEDYISDIKDEEIKSAKKIMPMLERGETAHFTLNREIRTWHFLMDFIGLMMKKGFEGPVVLHSQFTWSIIPLLEKEYNLLRQVVKAKGIIILSHDNYFWDRWASKQWEHIGAKIKIGQKNFAKQSDALVIGDYIINIYCDEDHLNWVREDSIRVKNEKDLDFNLLLEMILVSETKIDLIIRKDKIAAQKIKEETKKIIWL